MERILILGGGGGGAILANLLPEDSFDVTLVDRGEYHLFQPGNLFVAFCGKDKEKYRRPIKKLLKPNVRFIRDSVVDVNLNERKVMLKGKKKLEYDYIVITTGAYLNYDVIEGNRKLLDNFGDFYANMEDAERLWRTLVKMKEGKFVIAISDPIYKCPPGPHKGAFLSSCLFEKMGLKDRVDVVLAVPFPHVYPSKVISDVIDPELKRMRIKVHTFFTVDSVDVEKRKIYSLEGEELDYTVAVVIPPHEGPRYKIEPSEVKDDSNYVKIDKHTCRVDVFDDVYAIGDCTNAPTAKSGVTAHLQAEVVASRLQGFDAKFSGRTNCPLITDGYGLFVISDYDHPPIPVRLSRFKRFLEDLFVATYWDAIRYPELWQPIFHSFFEATSPERLGKRGW